MNPSSPTPTVETKEIVKTDVELKPKIKTTAAVTTKSTKAKAKESSSKPTSRSTKSNVKKESTKTDSKVKSVKNDTKTKKPTETKDKKSTTKKESKKDIKKDDGNKKTSAKSDKTASKPKSSKDNKTKTNTPSKSTKSKTPAKTDDKADSKSSDKSKPKVYTPEQDLPSIYGKGVNASAVTVSHFTFMTQSILNIPSITPTQLLQELEAPHQSEYLPRLLTSLLFRSASSRAKWSKTFAIDLDVAAEMLRLVICKIHVRAVADTVESDDESGDEDHDESDDKMTDSDSTSHKSTRTRAVRSQVTSSSSTEVLKSLKMKVVSSDITPMRLDKDSVARRDRTLARMKEAFGKNIECDLNNCINEFKIEELKPYFDTLCLFRPWNGANPLANTSFLDLKVQDRAAVLAVLCDYRALTKEFSTYIAALPLSISRGFTGQDARNIRYWWLPQIDWHVYGQLPEVCTVSDVALYSSEELKHIERLPQPAKPTRTKKEDTSTTDATLPAVTDDAPASSTTSSSSSSSSSSPTQGQDAEDNTDKKQFMKADTETPAPVLPHRPTSPLRYGSERAIAAKRISTNNKYMPPIPNQVPAFVSLQTVISNDDATGKTSKSQGRVHKDGLIVLGSEDVSILGVTTVDVSQDNISDKLNKDVLNPLNYIRPSERRIVPNPNNNSFNLTKLANIPELFLLSDSEASLKTLITKLRESRHTRDIELSKHLYATYNETVGGVLDEKTLEVKVISSSSSSASHNVRKCKLDHPDMNVYIGLEREKARRKIVEQNEFLIKRSSERVQALEWEKRENDRLQQILAEERKREENDRRKKAFCAWCIELLTKLRLEAQSMGIKVDI